MLLIQYNVAFNEQPVLQALILFCLTQGGRELTSYTRSTGTRLSSAPVVHGMPEPLVIMMT